MVALRSLPSPVRVLLPWGFLSLQSTVGGKTSALLVRRSLWGLTAFTAAWEVFTFPLIPANYLCGSPSLEIRPPSESRCAASPPHLRGATPSLRVSVPSGAISTGSPLTCGILPIPLRSAFRFSQPPDGLLLPMPCGLVPCHWHPLGSPFRALPFQGAVPTLDGRCPPVVPRPAPRVRKRATLDGAAFRALLPLKVRCQPFVG